MGGVAIEADSRRLLEKLASTEPTTLATMHGSSYRGNGSALLLAFAETHSGFRLSAATGARRGACYLARWMDDPAENAELVHVTSESRGLDVRDAEAEALPALRSTGAPLRAEAPSRRRSRSRSFAGRDAGGARSRARGAHRGTASAPRSTTCSARAETSRFGCARRTARAEPTRHGRLGRLAGPAPTLEPLDIGALFRCFPRPRPERGRTVVQLSFNEEKTAEEIAVVVETTPGNVRVLRHRAVAQLRRCLDAIPGGRPMNASVCPAAIPWEELVAYWAGDLDEEATSRLDEEHLMGCGVCSLSSERVATVTEGVRAMIPALVSHERIRALREKGLHIVENPVAASERKPAVFQAGVDVLLHRLQLDLTGVEQIEVTVTDEGTGRVLFVDPYAPFDPSKSEILVACQRHFGEVDSSIVFDVRLEGASVVTEGEPRHSAIPHVFGYW